MDKPLPRRCHYDGCDWGAWGLFKAARDPLKPGIDESAQYIPIKAYRFRQCRFCGQFEREDYYGGRIKIKDTNHDA